MCPTLPTSQEPVSAPAVLPAMLGSSCPQPCSPWPWALGGAHAHGWGCPGVSGCPAPAHAQRAKLFPNGTHGELPCLHSILRALRGKHPLICIASMHRHAIDSLISLTEGFIPFNKGDRYILAHG